MKATVKFDLDSPQANGLLAYLRTLPFTTVKTTPATRPSKAWLEAIKGGCTVDEFFDELRRRIDKWPDNENA